MPIAKMYIGKNVNRWLLILSLLQANAAGNIRNTGG